MNNWPNAQQSPSSNLTSNAQLTQNFVTSTNNNNQKASTHALKPFPEAMPSTQTLTVTSGSRISDIIEKAADYSTIIVEPGKYFECINVTKPLYFQANGKVSLRSDGTKECLNIQSPFVSFTGFSIKQKKTRIRGAVKIASGAAIFQNCVFKTLALPTILIQNDSLVQIKNCKVYGTKNPALQVSNKSQIESVNTVFSNSLTSLINITNEAVGFFSHCTFNESRNGGVTSSELSHLTIDNSTFTHSMVEFRSSSSGCSINNCTLSNDSLIKTNNNCTDVTISQNNLSDSMIQIDGSSTSILNSNRYNSSSLVARKTSISTLENEFFTGKSDSSIRVMENAKMTIKNSILSYVTGYGIVSYDSSFLTVDKCQFKNISNNSIIGHSGCDVTLSNLVFQNSNQTPLVFNSISQANLAHIRIESSNGNGCEINGCQKHVTISESHFQSNQKCGLVLSNNSSGVTINNNCSFTSNGFSGIHITSSPVQIINGLFKCNKKGSIFVSSGSKLIVDGTTFSDNSEWSAVYVDGQSQLQIDHSVFKSNNASINVDGEAEIVRTKFDSNLKSAALQVTGKAAVNGCEFTNNKCAIIAAGKASVTVEKTVFTSSETHIQTQNNAVCQCTECTFTKASGESAIRVAELSSLDLMKCEVKNNYLVGVASDSKTSIRESVISNSKKIGVLCNKGATGEIRDSKICENGESAVLCVGGTPNIIDNSISNNGKFGIYIASKNSPSVENNTFSQNKLANIWHSE